MFLLPSLYEGLPMVGVEAQCAGLPLVCSKEVTDEVAIGEATFLSLEKPASQWAHHVSQASSGAETWVSGRRVRR